MTRHRREKIVFGATDQLSRRRQAGRVKATKEHGKVVVQMDIAVVRVLSIRLVKLVSLLSDSRVGLRCIVRSDSVRVLHYDALESTTTRSLGSAKDTSP
jgi:hypothetical protein